MWQNGSLSPAVCSHGAGVHFEQSRICLRFSRDMVLAFQLVSAPADKLFKPCRLLEIRIFSSAVWKGIFFSNASWTHSVQSHEGNSGFTIMVWFLLILKEWKRLRIWYFYSVFFILLPPLRPPLSSCRLAFYFLSFCIFYFILFPAFFSLFFTHTRLFLFRLSSRLLFSSSSISLSVPLSRSSSFSFNIYVFILFLAGLLCLPFTRLPT